MGRQFPNRNFLTGKETSSARNEFHLIKSLVKGTPWKPLNNHGFCQGN